MGTLSPEVSRRNYEVVFNPSTESFIELVGKIPGRKILEVGCGNPPRVSLPPERNGLWVGCDPAIPVMGHEKLILPRNFCAEGAKFVVFPWELDDRHIPSFHPDLIVLTAPNPKDVVEGLLYQLERFLEKGQEIQIALDTRTHEAKTLGKEAVIETKTWLIKHGFQFKSGKVEGRNWNSADMGNEAIVFIGKKVR